MSALVELAAPAQGLERLGNLKRVLTDVGARAKLQVAAGRMSPFQMSIWGQDVSEEKRAPACGTQACAAGWAAYDEWFQSQGLSIGKANRYGSEGTIMELRFNGIETTDAFTDLAAFFGIEESDAMYLFHPDSYEQDGLDWDDDTCCPVIETDDVIAHIDCVIEENFKT